MNRRSSNKAIKSLIKDELANFRNDLHKEFAGVLHDISYRINVLRETKTGERVHTSDLNIATHMLDGYTFANNTPAAGSVAWTDLHIVYKGVTYEITDGNTSSKFLWWQFSATDKTKLATSATKPALTMDDILVGINDGGTFTLTMGSGKLVPGSALMDGSVGSNELGNNAVTSLKIASGAVGNGQLGDGAVSGTKIADGGVAGTKIADSAISSAKIADGAVGSTELASGAVTSGKIGANAVGSTNIAAGAVGQTQIGAGAVAESNLDVATHFIF